LAANLQRLEYADMPKLIVTTDAQGKIAYECNEDLVSIGRAPDCAVIIDDPSVSGHHAQLEIAGETYRLKDLESTNGTRVNGIPITNTLLRFDDRIRFGAVEARYEPDIRGSQPLPPVEQIKASGAQTSMAPVDFENASPFPRRTKERDPVQTALIAGAILALLAFIGGMVAVLAMHAPVL
jgi:pSer/pThr/pTyr-binding forkhead associated (FHA) protein